MSVFLLWLFIAIYMCSLLPIDQKYQMTFGYASKVDYSYLVISNAVINKNWTMLFIYFFEWFENCGRKDDKWHIRKN